MLQELLDFLKEHPRGVDQGQICAELGITPAGLQPLLDILVRKGRVIPVSPAGMECFGGCRTCPALLRCQDEQTNPGILYQELS